MRGEFEFKLTTPKRGGRYPEQLPPLEADAAKPSWLISTDVEVLDQQGNQQTGGPYDAYEPGGYYYNTRGPTGPPNPRITTTDPDRPSTKKVAMSGRWFHEKQNTETTSILREC